MIPTEWLFEARQRINPYVRQTPITFDAGLDVYFKWENLQITGSFKARGAVNKILSLQSWERQKGLITASAGNHGAGLAYACSITKDPVHIFVPQSTPQIKINHIQDYGGIIHFIPGSYGDTERSAIDYAQQNQAIYISPYNDGQVIAGQATIAMETIEQLKENKIAAWVVPVGGGGLISGIGTAIKAKLGRDSNPAPLLIGIQPEASPFMYHLFKYNHQDNITELPTLADGASGEVEPSSITIPIVKQLVDDFILVTEDEIKTAIRYAWQRYQQVIEGSAALTLAAVLSNRITKRPLLLVMSGGNIQTSVYQQILEEI